ncbi:unnamed protein product [Arctogadus glacialis]
MSHSCSTCVKVLPWTQCVCVCGGGGSNLPGCLDKSAPLIGPPEDQLPRQRSPVNLSSCSLCSLCGPLLSVTLLFLLLLFFMCVCVGGGGGGTIGYAVSAVSPGDGLSATSVTRKCGKVNLSLFLFFLYCFLPSVR